VHLADGGEVSAHTVLIATGVAYRRLNVPGLDELTGRGVHYGAAVADAQSVSGQDVYVIGGANSAGQAAVYLARVARQVTLLVRADRLEKSMSQYLVDQIQAISNIRVELNSEVVAVSGEQHLEAITLANRAAGSEKQVTADFLFVFIGAYPHTDWVGEAIARDDRGFIVSGPELRRDGIRAGHWTGSRCRSRRPAGVFVAAMCADPR
jgi:thioredoxin reductase (NADPH)